MNHKHEMNNKKTNPNYTFELYSRTINELPPIKEKRKSKLMPLFATFMAGALVVGSLAYVADYFNFFTSSNVVAGTTEKYIGSIVQTSHTNQTEKQSAAATYEVASQAVVKIENYSTPSQNSLFNDPRMWMYFSDGSQVQPNDAQDSREDGLEQGKLDLSQMELAGSGTGYLFESDGYILTNEHVIHGAEYVSVTVPGYEEPFEATVVSSSSELDIAVLKIEPVQNEEFPTISLGDSDQINVGEWVMAIGNPYGYDYTLTMGIISAKERPITIENSEGEPQQFEHMLQTDTSINPGNSGGPLLNEQGEVIGMNTAVNSEAQGMGFAIPINVIKDYLSTISL